MLLNKPSEFDSLEIGLASPEKIRYWSYGEVEKPETINYRTFKPERRGLFCEKIFGPVKDWECSCGKYRRVRYRGIICERCGVEVTHSKVRRERMGHIELAAPVSHIWFLKGVPSFASIILGMTSRALEEIIYYDSYIVVESNKEIQEFVPKNQILSTEDYYSLKEKYKDQFKAEMGASAIKKILQELDVKKIIKTLRSTFEGLKGQNKLKVIKRLRTLEALQKSRNKPEWMILDAIPIMPPDLRPMVQLEGGRFATSDLNDLYRRVVNRNNRLKRLMDIGAPEMIIRNEKRMLQESVDVLIANGKRGRAVTGSNGRPLKSLGNIIEGKQGRFRQNLLGKRVDYSGRSVIVVGPHLKIHQCGLPKEMGLELFKPFVIRKLVEYGHASNVKSAKRKTENREVIVWDVLDDVIKGQSILLNRAPTLHRLGIQAFEPILVEGSAIQIHPLVCASFNADFDGDQMAIHIPLSLEAQAECRLLIMSTNNILSPSSGRSIMTPSQDMVLGIYYLTASNPEYEDNRKKIFYDINEAFRALDNQAVQLQSNIIVRYGNERYHTTIGRLILNYKINQILLENQCEKHEFINNTIGKKDLSHLVLKWYYQYGNLITSLLIDELKNIGFKYSTLSGISISVDDMVIPKNKALIINQAEDEINKLSNLHQSKSISHSEKKYRSHDIWRKVTQDIATDLSNELGELNNVYIMANSGARGNMDQVRQLAGIRGLMSDSQGRIVDIPIKSNFKEGMNLTEYFLSTYGARKGLVDTALRTADSGYLTRRLVDVAQDVIVTIDDCHTKQGINNKPLFENGKIVVPLYKTVEGRVSMEKVVDPNTNKTLVKKGELITIQKAEDISKLDLQSLKTRNVLTCEAERGLCQKCYGLDLANGRIINKGEAVGIIAAQSIGEPGTQLTMRTFHTGGVDLRKSSVIDMKSLYNGIVEFPDDIKLCKLKTSKSQQEWIITQSTSIKIKTESNEYYQIDIPTGATLLVKDKETISKGQSLASYDESYKYLMSNSEGIAKFINLELEERKEDNKSTNEFFTTSPGEIFIEYPKKLGIYTIKNFNTELFKVGDRIKVSDFKNMDADLNIGGIIKSIKEVVQKRKTKIPTVEVTITLGHAYQISVGTQVFVKNNEKIIINDILTKERLVSLDASKTQDIVQGLPRVEELFEARRPKDSALVSHISGVVEIGVDKDDIPHIYVLNETENKSYKIPQDARILVYSGQSVEKGDLMTEGVINPHDILETKGVLATQLYLSTEIQSVYRSQGVHINIKHCEVIIKQMTRKRIIVDMGDSTILLNETLDGKTINKINIELKKENKKPVTTLPVLLGITRSSLNTESFVSAASFQQTSSVLTKAAIEGQTDPMYGLKENVIIGRLIPAGTGIIKSSQIKLTSKYEEIPDSQEDLKSKVNIES